MFLREQDLGKMIEINDQMNKMSLELKLIETEEYYLRFGNLDELMDEVITAKKKL